jgi:hypothetical protein
MQERWSNFVLTIFAIPKPFRGHIGTIQWNAIRSWSLLEPRPQIILFGNEEGIAEIARDWELFHIPAIARNEFGTPLLNDVLDKAYERAGQGVLCYVNADIILTRDFPRTIEAVSPKYKRFLLVSKRMDLDVVEKMGFQADWEASLKNRVAREGVAGPHTAIDVFAFAGEMYRHAPPFAIGRMWFDHWFIKAARMAQIPVVDVSPVAPVVHQNHDYAHIRGGRQEIFTSEEGRRNQRYYGAGPESFTLLDVTHELAPDGRLRSVHLRRPAFRVKEFAWKIFVRNTAVLRNRIGLRRGAWLKPPLQAEASENPENGD